MSKEMMSHCWKIMQKKKKKDFVSAWLASVAKPDW